jgi:hypothetical protein
MKSKSPIAILATLAFAVSLSEARADTVITYQLTFPSTEHFQLDELGNTQSAVC